MPCSQRIKYELAKGALLGNGDAEGCEKAKDRSKVSLVFVILLKEGMHCVEIDNE